MEDRRTAPRFRVPLPLTLAVGQARVKTTAQNISCSGIYCQINEFIPLKTSLNVTMHLPAPRPANGGARDISCPAVISRVEPPQDQGDGVYHVGISFSQLAGQDRTALIAFIHSKNLQEARELKEMYLLLKDMAARLVELGESHPTATHFRKVINKAIIELDTVAHILDHEINELKQLE